MARFGAPSLLTRNTNDVQQIQMLVLTTFTLLIAAPIMMVGGVFMALREDTGLAWLIAVTVVVLVVIIAFLLCPACVFGLSQAGPLKRPVLPGIRATAVPLEPPARREAASAS